MTFKYPVAELAANGENFTEEVVLNQALEFLHAREPELVLHYAVFHTGIATDLIEFVSVFSLDRSWLFAIDVLASRCSSFHGREAAQCGLRVEVDRIRRVTHDAVEIRGVFLNAGLCDQRLEFSFIAADKNRIRHDALGWADLNAALFDDRVDGTKQMLVSAHASCDAVHDDAYFMCFHNYVFRF